MSWNPLDDGFLTSTVLRLGPTPVAIWAMLIASADRYGNSKLTPIAAAALLRIKDEEAIEAFKRLASPDKHSRNEETEGRRITKNPDGTWHLVSHTKYRKLAAKSGAVERTLAWRERKRKGMKDEPDERNRVPGGGTSTPPGVQSDEARLAGSVGDEKRRSGSVRGGEAEPGGEANDRARDRTGAAREGVSPRSSPDIRGDEPREHRGAGPANPLLRGRREELELELQRLVALEAQLTNRDPLEVFAEVSHYDGARRNALNAATMTDDRLGNSVLDARARVKALEARRKK